MSIKYNLVRFLKHLRPSAVRHSSFGEGARIGSASQIVESSIGRFSYCGSDCTIINAAIGDFCSIADYVMIGGARHAIDRVSSSPVFHQGRNPCGRNFTSHAAPEIQRTVIGHDVWIGHGAKIASGISISNGAVIGMGAVVTRDVLPFAIVGGTPAKILGFRFDAAVRDRLQVIEWWNWSEEKIQKYGHYFDDPTAFIGEVE